MELPKIVYGEGPPTNDVVGEHYIDLSTSNRYDYNSESSEWEHIPEWDGVVTGVADSLEVMREKKLGSLQQAYMHRLNAYDTITCAAGTFDLSRVELTQITNTLIAANLVGDDNTAYVTTLTDREYMPVPINKADAAEILEEQLAIEVRIGEYYRDISTQAAEATTIESLQNVVWDYTEDGILPMGHKK